jgi:hypothetical protein
VKIGTKVRVLPPFNHTFSGEYVIEAVVDGQYKLTGIEGLFVAVYLEEV